MSLLFLVCVTDIVTLSLVFCSLPETHQEAVYGALFSFPCRVSASKSGRQLYSYVFYSVIFSPSRNETEEQRWRVEEKKPIRLETIGILEGKTPSLNTSVIIFFQISLPLQQILEEGCEASSFPTHVDEQFLGLWDSTTYKCWSGACCPKS